jgi:hypothetical protein
MKLTVRMLAALVATLFAATLAPTAAPAHTQTLGLGGKKILINTSKAPRKQKFVFVSAKELPFDAPSPIIWGSWLVVEGKGANPGKTELVQLDPDLWEGKGDPPGFKGWQYKDKAGTAGGVTKILLKPGSLKITAKGEGWSWDMLGPQQSVGVHLRLGQAGEEEYEWLCTVFGGDIRKNEAGLFKAKGAEKLVECPSQVCGNGELEFGEGCDDGNNDETDGCLNDCTVGVCSGVEFGSTYEGIQAVIFDNPAYGPCSNGLCHGAMTPQGELSLVDGDSHANLVGMPSFGDGGLLDRVAPGDKDASSLWEKLESKISGTIPSFGSAMPTSGSALSADHLEALRLWIQGGAPETGVVAGTAALLGSCLPDPTPLTIPVPEVPANGAQFWSNPWELVSQAENEVCFATYYDLTGKVPAESIVACPSVCANGLLQPCATNADCGTSECVAGSPNNPSGDCFAYNSQTIYQDPQSHHAFVRIYLGQFDTTDSGWGAWTHKFQDQSNALEGQSCDPLAINPAFGYNPGCSSQTQEAVACLGAGPVDLSQGSSEGLTGSATTPTFSGSGTPVFEQSFPDGVHSVLPMQGILVWNSHAFNLTSLDTTMSIYQNLDFAGVDDQVYQVQPIFDDSAIFVQEVPPFQTREYCRAWTAPQGARIFLLTSHTHQWGVRWRTWGPPNAPCGGGCTPRNDAPLYLSTTYSDPLNRYFDPTIDLDSADPADRTFLFCSLYDNGSTPSSPPLKRQSTSVDPPLLFGLPIGPGGPCSDADVQCVGGPRSGQNCLGDDAFCDSSAGAGDGDCDACPVRGGVTTTDEMFILQGALYVVPPGP